MKAAAESFQPNMPAQSAGSDTPRGAADRRWAWLAGAGVLFAASSLWFGWLQPPHPDIGHHDAPLSPGWWWYPVESNQAGRLTGLGDVDLNDVAFADAEHGWAVGAAGTILHTADGGMSWQAQTNIDWNAPEVARPGGSRPPAREKAARAAWLLGLLPSALAQTTAPYNQAAPQRPTTPSNLKVPSELQVVDPSKASPSTRQTPPIPTNLLAPSAKEPTAPPQLQVPPAASSKPHLRAVAASGDRNQAWAAGDGGVILHTTDSGRTWSAQASGVTNNLTQIQFVGSNLGWAIGDGRLLHTRDGGANWGLLPDADVVLGFISFVDGRQGWASGSSGGLYRTTNGGSKWLGVDIGGPWSSKYPVVFVNAEVGWVAGVSGPVYYTRDSGATWQPQLLAGSPAKLELRDIAAADVQHAWALDPAGWIYRFQMGNGQWQAIQVTTNSSLAAMVFADALRGWVVGGGGTILHTRDGGQRWFPQSREAVTPKPPAGASLQRAYRRFPAPAYLLCLMGTGVMLRQGLRRPAPIRVSRSIADNYISDRPLGLKDPDALGFKSLADGLVNYLRNERTAAPLVLSIMGAWGSGKSSLMNLVRLQLQQHGFRPVWFNAWHHAREENLLAALLENIRQQAVPPWFSRGGLRFRLYLALERFPRQWVGFTLVPLLLVAAVVFLILGGPEGGGRSLLDIDLQDPARALEDLVKLLPWGATLAPAFVLLRLLRAFGASPGKLLVTAAAGAKSADLDAQTSLRYRFAREFSEVTRALQALSPRRTLTVFIDDLDRCQPDQMMEVLEAVNYLATEGECYIVLGMEDQVVKDCLASKLSWRFEQEGPMPTDPVVRHQKQREYATKWLEKLVQVEILVPTPSPDKAKAMLAAVSQTEGSDQAEDEFDFLKVARFLAPFVVVGGLMVGGGILGKKLASMKKPAATAEESTAGSNWVVAGTMFGSNVNLVVSHGQLPASGVAGGATSPTRTSGTDVAGAPPARGGSSGQLKLEPAGRSSAWSWLIVGVLGVAVISAGVRALLIHPQEIVGDSDRFRSALDQWWPLIETKSQTPRSLKRLVNRIRFFAMMARDSGGPTGLGEEGVVGYGALLSCAPGVLDGKADVQTLPSDLQPLAKDIMQQTKPGSAGEEFVRLTKGVKIRQ